MKQTRQSNQTKPNGAKQQDAARLNLETFGDVDTPEKIADDDSVTSSFKDFESSVDKFAGGIATTAISQAKETVAHAKDAITQLREAVAQAKETVSQAKSTIEAVKETARQVLVHMRKNPEPFIAAAIPGLIGVYLLIQKIRKPALKA